MRLTLSTATIALSLLGVVGPARADGTPADKPASPEDILGDIVVVAGAGRPLPKIAVVPSLAAAMEDVTLRSVVVRDLDLSGEFEILPDSKAPDALYWPDSPVDLDAWAQKGVEAVVRVSGKPAGEAQATLHAEVYFIKQGATPVFDRTFTAPEASLRMEAHRVADVILGALTGQNGGFASHMAFVSGTGSARRIITIDADGHDAREVSPPGQAAMAPAFGKGEDLYYTASINNDVYRLFGPGGAPVALPVQGSVYGIAFSRDRSQVALSIGIGDSIKLFVGPDFASIKPASPVGLAIHPTFTPRGEIAFAGEGKFGQRIFVGDKPITPEGIFASSPTFCNHPDGVRAVFAVGVGLDADLVSTGEHGGPLVRLTQRQGRNSYPACSPDGRIIAFFSTRTVNEGPGLYIMRIDGGRPRRISGLIGDSLRWDPL